MQIDWTQVRDVSETIAAIVAIYGSLYVLGRLTIRAWRRTVGRRRQQSQLLDQLACGEPIERVNTWLGLPVSSSGDGYTYDLPGCWVFITEAEGVVESFAITIRDSRMYYRTRLLTAGMYDLKLGRSTFGDIGLGKESGYTWIGARRMGARVLISGANPSLYQEFSFAFNDAGIGYIADLTDDERQAGWQVSPETTINTLRVVHPFLSSSRQEALNRDVQPVGVDLDVIRLRVAKDVIRFRETSLTSRVRALLRRKRRSVGRSGS
ncbi:hypothetical protein EV646_12412 [Kribbella antiqua]|uniref:Uncharacterized protein n=1 Tax=Kribbella antiqua TaxID=2512217 RepID=A0A4R2I0A3_9ACTN|nr:hypothetical protein EV646_12412 [Kribbella antiqua]